MAVRKPLVLIGGQVQELPAADTLPGGGGSAAIPLDGWFFAVYPGRWSEIKTIGASGGLELLGAGTVDCPAPGSAGLRQSLPRFTLTGSAAANSAFECSAAPARPWRGNAAGRGGFRYRQRLSVTSTVTGQRGLFGLNNYSGSYGASQSPYGLAHTLGLAFDAAVDSNYQIIHAGAGAATKVNLGSGFALGNPAAVLDVQFVCAPNASTIDWSVTDLNSGAMASGTLTANLPGNTEFLFPRVYMSNAGTAAAVSCDVMLIHASSY